MRLIDADALKKAIAEFHKEENERLHNPLWGSIGLNALNRLIDYAPTVPLPDFKEGYKQAILDGKTNYSRQPGEWIKGREISREMISDTILHIDYENFTCSNCGLVLDNLLYHADGSPFYKYCPQCGAKMFKEKVTKNEQ